MKNLKAPFPAFGGKTKVASYVWDRLGNVRNYIEPFCFSAAVLWARPHEPGVETINDVNCYVANFWRAVQADPESVVDYCNWPVNECDLHARHKWLVSQPEFIERMKSDPDYYDPRIAGWWVWGACCWIGSGWCVNKAHDKRRPHLLGPMGINSKIPDISGDSGASGRGIHKKPKLSSNGVGAGVHSGGRVQLADQYSRGRGVHANDSAGKCEGRRLWLLDWFGRLQDRLRPVRVCCGDWARVCTSLSTTTRIGLTGVFLDPPYPRKTGKGTRDGYLYSSDVDGNKSPEQIRDEVLAYCRERGDNPMFRIAVCGYEGDGYEDLGWEVHYWKTNGGYGNQGKKNENKHRERIWFSPHCQKVGLF
jgi:hypothetical protein